MRSGTPPTPKLGKTWRTCGDNREGALLPAVAKAAIIVAVREESFLRKPYRGTSERKFTLSGLRSNVTLYVSRDKFAKRSTSRKKFLAIIWPIGASRLLGEQANRSKFLRHARP